MAKAVVQVSDFKTGGLGKAYGLEIVHGPFQSPIGRSVAVIDPSGKFVDQ